MKSSDGQIYVLLVNKDPESDYPVAVQVPPPKDIGEYCLAVHIDQTNNQSHIKAGRRCAIHILEILNLFSAAGLKNFT